MFKRPKEPEKKGSEKREDLLVSFLKVVRFVFAIIELATRNYNTTATRFSADMALLTDMLDAAASRLDAEQQLVGAQINIIYFYYKLLSTSGTI